MTKEYIAGFFDGEGSIVHNGKGYRITIAQTNKTVLKEIQALTGVGSIFKNRKRQPHWKESWVYYIAKQADVSHFLQLIHPFLIVKKRAASRTVITLGPVLEKIQSKNQTAKYRKEQSIKFRKQGLTYREIGERLGIDWSYSRRLILRQLKKDVK